MWGAFTLLCPIGYADLPKGSICSIILLGSQASHGPLPQQIDSPSPCLGKHGWRTTSWKQEPSGFRTNVNRNHNLRLGVQQIELPWASHSWAHGFPVTSICNVNHWEFTWILCQFSDQILQIKNQWCPSIAFVDTKSKPSLEPTNSCLPDSCTPLPGLLQISHPQSSASLSPETSRTLSLDQALKARSAGKQVEKLTRTHRVTKETIPWFKGFSSCDMLWWPTDSGSNACRAAHPLPRTP